MWNALVSSMTLVGTGGYAIMASICLILGIAVALSLSICRRYARMEDELGREPDPDRPFCERALHRAVQDAREATRRSPGRAVNTQAVVEQHFQVSLRGLLLGERFIRSSTGLTIILGLVGTFLGLTLSIGRLAHLISGDVSKGVDIAQPLTQGLTQTL